jgi:HEAT repeat protein
VPPGEVARLRQAVQGRVDAVVAGLAPRLTPVAGLLEDEDVRVRLAACEALEAAGTLRSVLRRGELLPVQDPFAKGMAQVVPGLEKNLAHKEVRVRLGALYALETAGPESVKAAGTIVKAAGDDDAFVRWAAVRALGKIAPEAARQAVPALVKRLEDSSEDVRWTAALVLGRYGPAATEAAPALGKLIEKGRLALRLQAAAAVEAIGPKAAAAAPALVKALADTEVEVRRAAARALGRLDVAEKADVAAALRKALDDSDETVRQSAGRALLGEK